MSGVRMNGVSSSDVDGLQAALAGELNTGFRSFGATVRLVQSTRGVVLEGVSSSFYGKQMAQELVRKAKLIVVANRIQVQRASN